MKRINSLVAMFGFSALIALSGCGANNRESGSTTETASFAKSQACIGCHSTKQSPVTGALIVDEWKASAHNTRNGASCPDCHATNGHPNSGLTPSIPTAAECQTCHTATTMSTYNAHFVGAATRNASQAAYVTPYESNSCIGCHNPHDTTTLLTVNKQWAESGHGKVTNDPWKHYLWRQPARVNAGCSRCHTAEGSRQYLQNGYTYSAPALLAKFGKYTTGTESLGCKGCHTDYSWNRITPATAFTAPYTASLGASATFPDATIAGDSQLCFTCHAGLAGGQAIADLTTAPSSDFGSFNSHYMAAAGIMYVKSGFASFTTATAPATRYSGSTAIATSYGSSLKSSDDGGDVTSTHRILGTAAMATDSHVGGRSLITGGPCVTCHMKGGHSLEINADAFTRVCSKCHTSEGTTTLTTDNFMEVFVDEQKIPFDNAMALAKNQLAKYGITYDSANYPYFWPTAVTDHSNRANGFKDWSQGGTLTAAQAKRLLGAAFNINILSREPAAYVHARTYTRRLLYDTIDFLDDLTINRSVSTTAAAFDSALYTVTPDATTATESLKYLKGYNRTSNAWTAWPRP